MVCVRCVLVCAALLAATAANPSSQLQNDTLNEDEGVETETTEGSSGEDGACACPSDKPCLRLCKKSVNADGAFNESFRNENISIDIQLEIWEKNSSRPVRLFDHFTVVPESKCKRIIEFLDETFFFVNGSICSNEVELLFHPEEFCVTLINNSLEIEVCPNFNTENGLRFYLYPPFFILSAVCLALTLFAYQFCQETKTLHEKAIYCQSTALFFSFVTLTINYITGDISHIDVCVNLAYTNYFFLMVSFFWLNVMYIDIFLTFRSLTRVTRPKYWQASIYAWGIPFLLLVTTIVFDQKTKGPYSPGIGKCSCWFNGILAELIYFHGPVIALLLINLVLFGLTAYNLWIVSSESKRVLQSPESGKQKASSDQALQESDRFVLFIKLFLLMGCTWLMEIVSWAVGGDEIIWFLPDVINSTRGVFVFWFCVWSKKALRKSLFRFLCKCVKNEKKQLSEHNSTEIIVNDTSIYGSYREIYGQW